MARESVLSLVLHIKVLHTPLSELEKKKPLNRQAQSANKRLFFNKMSIPWLRQTAIPKECNKITNFTETNQIKSPKNGTSI